MKCFRSGQFTPLIPLLPLPQTEQGVLDFGHSPLTPLPKIQNKKTKLKFFFRAIPIAIGIKVKHAHHITRHIWLRLLYKSLHPYLPPLRYGKHQICRNVIQNVAPIVARFWITRADTSARVIGNIL